MKIEYTNEDIAQFWQTQNRFLKSGLATEAPHPKTQNLSQICQTNLPQALEIFQEVELDAIIKLKDYMPEITKLQQDMQKCLREGHKIFLMGCGASGRVAMLLKRLWEYTNPKSAPQIVCVSSGGDISLIRSVEQFEDQPEWGIEQLKQQGLTKQDLLIGLSASGESPFIVAAVEYAAKNNHYTPYLICNNSIESLLNRIPDSVVANPKAHTLALDVGPMALTASSRLQATTAMHVALGLALTTSSQNEMLQKLDKIIQVVKNVPITKMADVVMHEAEIIQSKEYVLYQTENNILGLSLLSDMTERSPTFNLTPLENQNEVNSAYSTYYLSIDKTASSMDAWNKLLGQQPTCLNWPNTKATSSAYIQGFDLAQNSARAGAPYLPKLQHHEVWQQVEDQIEITFDDIHINLPTSNDLLCQSLVYKLSLNATSTILMGNLGYFDGNLMLSLTPTNFKLVDRAIRYSLFILQHRHNLNIEYKDLAQTMFEEIAKLQPNQSIVHMVVNRYIN